MTRWGKCIIILKLAGLRRHIIINPKDQLHILALDGLQGLLNKVAFITLIPSRLAPGGKDLAACFLSDLGLELALFLCPPGFDVG